MLRRLILAVLTLCLSIPAVAMPLDHAVPAQAAMVMHGGKHDCEQTPAEAPQPGDHAKHHGCIGCIARYDGLFLPAKPVQIAFLVLPARLPAQNPQDCTGPETPPPRA
ncbi:MAG: hypothetical protein ACKOQ3_05730 [Novosphingobium sp.]